MIDLLLIVSSHIDRCCARPLMHGCDQAQATYCFNSGGECLSYVETLPETASVIAIVDSRIRDISSLNLVNALRMTHAFLQAIVVVSSDDKEVTQRAMFAGACSAVFETCGEQDLNNLITKVAKSSLFRRSTANHASDATTPQGCAIAVVSARGGSGKSYLASLLAATLARAHKETLLLDGDIQFSDLGLLFHKSETVDITTIEGLAVRNASTLRGLAYHVADRLNLIRFDASPLRSDTLASKVMGAVRLCRFCFEATVINTGGFWSLFQTNLLESCNCIIVTCDHTLAGIKATKQLLDYFEHLHVPLAQVLVVVTRFSKRGIALQDIEATLGSIPVITLGELDNDACISMEAGQPTRVLNESDAVAESFTIIAERISEMTGMPLHGIREFDAQIRRGGLLSRVFGR